MAARPAARLDAVEVHHQVPRCLLRLRDRADAHTKLDGEGIQKWLDYELEALRCGVDPDLGREELAALIEGSTVEIPREEHRAMHAGQWAEWSRLGGLSMARRYGTAWFSLLARKRWERITAEALTEVFGALSGSARGAARGGRS